MDEALKVKLDEAREWNSQQAGINADRKREDRATRSGPEENSGQRMRTGLCLETR